MTKVVRDGVFSFFFFLTKHYKNNSSFQCENQQSVICRKSTLNTTYILTERSICIAIILIVQRRVIH